MGGSISFFNRITEWLRSAGSSGGHLVQPPSSSRATESQLLRTMSTQLLNISKVRGCRTSLGNLCQCLVTLTVKKCLLMFRGNLLCFRFGLLLWSCHWAPLKRAWHYSFCPLSFQAFIHIDEIPLSLLFSRLNSPSSLSLSPQEKRSSPFIVLVAIHCTLSSMATSHFCWGAQNWTQLSRRGLTSAEGRGRITSPSSGIPSLPFSSHTHTLTYTFPSLYRNVVPVRLKFCYVWIPKLGRQNQTVPMSQQTIKKPTV